MQVLLSERDSILQPWVENPYELVSWWDVEKFSAEKYLAICSNMTDLAYSGKGVHQEFTESGKKEVCKLLRRIAKDCRAVGLKSASIQFDELIDNVKHVPISGRQLSQILLCLGSAIRAEISTHLFMQIFPNRIEYYEQPELFGAEVNAGFPSAIRDIRSCGSCYACDRNTASVMHSMRVLEAGLGVLASELTVPSDRRNWEQIIRDIEIKIEEIQKKREQWGQNWKEKLEFYSGAAKDFRYFKDAWRNHVMHFREHYDAAEALTILNHVKAFMEHLVGGGLKEQTQP